MATISSPVVEVQMMIRKPVSKVFDAFIDPAITCKFWFSKGSAKLDVGKTITWDWEMYGVSTKVNVREIIKDKKIVVEWNEPITTVEFEFQPLSESTTYLVIRNYGFKQTGEDLINTIKDNTGGFTTVVDGCKVYLEHNIQLNLISDKFPTKLV